MFLYVVEEHTSQIVFDGIILDILVSSPMCFDADGVQGDGVPFHIVIRFDSQPEAGKDIVLDEVAADDG